MSLELDPTLQTAQDGQAHNPIIEIKASQWTDDIPFDGQILKDTVENERNPNTIMHSSGRLCAVHIYQSSDKWYIRYAYTDTNRSTFSFVNFTSYYNVVDVSICELVGGNIGIIYRYDSGGYVRYKTLSVTGTQIADGTVFNSTLLSGPSVKKLADNTYLMVYTKKVGSDYKFYKRTSSNFTSWASETEISIGGLTSTKRKANPSLVQISTGDIFLWFDYLEQTGASDEELTNIYYSISVDNGVTWGNAVKVTSYTDYSAKALHPMSVQKLANTLHMIFTDDRSALHMDNTTPGWCPNSYKLKSLHFDAVNRKLYSVIQRSSSGGVSCIIKIDVDTWAVEDYWNCSTLPGFSSGWCEFWFVPKAGKADGLIIPVIGPQAGIAVLNAESDTIKEYYFGDGTDWGKTRNVDWTPPVSDYSGYYVTNVQADYANNKLWVHLSWASGWHFAIKYGWIDLNETIAPDGKYTFHDQIGFYDSSMFSWLPTEVLFIPEEDLVMFSAPGPNGWAHTGQFTILVLSTGALWKQYDYATNPDFHHNGFTRFVYIPETGKVYGGFTYKSDEGQGDRRGLMEVDINTDAIQYHRPSWGTHDDYHLDYLSVDGDNNIWIGSDTYGVTKFNTIDLSWILYNNANLPGLTPSGWDNFRYIVFDDLKKMVYASSYSDWSGGWEGIAGFLETGRIQRSYYTIGEYTTSWAFPAATPLVLGFLDYDASIAFDPSDGGIYAFWVNKLVSEESIKWDKEFGDFNLSGYLIKGEEIVCHRTIDGNPAELNFAVSEGHLFDPHNNYSLWSIYLKKGRKLTLRLGEKISSVDYWQNQGVFTIDETSLSYERGSYPVMHINAKDRFAVWKNHDVVATDLYTILPKPTIEDIVTKHTDFIISDIDLPVFDGGIELYHQWLDTNIFDIVQQICNRFGYYPRIDVAGKLSARKISETGSVNHIYPDVTKIINFTPDDTFSDYTNRLTVTGQERSFIEITYAEERLSSMNGTVGWWGFKKDFTIYYSDDKSRRCVNPRLVKLETATSIMFSLAGKINEAITYEDPNNKYVVVTITAPNLSPILAAAIALLIASYWIPDDVWVSHIGAGGNFTILYPWSGSVIRAVALVTALGVLGSTGNYQYEIWAQPLGSIKRSIQGQANDLPFQVDCGMIVEKKFEDSMCYTVSQCLEVAEFELMIARLQRSRIKFSKIAHLQDEEGDIIQIPHPHTGTALEIYVTNLTRKIKIPEGPDGDGYCIDEVEGWKL